MRTPVLMIALSTAVLAVPMVLANTELATSSRPAVTYQPMVAEHADHTWCHTPIWSLYANCAAIRDSEKVSYVNDVNNNGVKTELFTDDGIRAVGRRDVYPTSYVTTTTDEATFSATAWLKRNRPLSTKLVAGTSAHPEWESAAVNSCDDYAYKLYYQANRQLDAIDQLAAANRWTEAVGVITNGIPVIGTTRGAPAVDAPALVDYDGRQLRIFRSTFDGGPLAGVEAPNNHNPFFNVPAALIQSLPSTGESWENNLPAALAASASRTPNPAEATWDYADTMRTNPQITALSNAELEDIAMRVTRMRDAQARAAKSFQDCTIQQFQSQTASTNVYPNGQTLQQYVQAITNDGVTDPGDSYELDLERNLIDDTLYASTLGNVVSTSLTTKDLFGTYARTRTGRVLRALAGINLTALQSAVYATKYTVKSASWNTCNAAYKEVGRLLVEEYNRGSNGCMASNTVRCDFSPVAFTKQVADRLADYTKYVDDAKGLCLEYLGDDFNSIDSPVPTDKRTSLTTFENFFKNRKDELDQILRSTPAASSLPKAIGDRRDGGTTWGDRSRFAAGYRYATEWGVDVIKKNGTHACQLGGQVEGQLSATVTLFGTDRKLLDAGLKARTGLGDLSRTTAERSAEFDAHVNLLGIDIFKRENEPLPTSRYTASNDDSFDITVVHTTIVLGFIPVTIEAGFGFDYGYTLTGSFTQSPCQDAPTLNLSGNVTPHMGADAFVSAYVDLFVVGAGVKGELTLVSAALPFHAGIDVRQDPTTGGFAAHAKSDVHLELTELSGSLSFVVKLFLVTVWEKELFRWPGIRQVIRLWNTETTFPFIAFDLLPT